MHSEGKAAILILQALIETLTSENLLTKDRVIQMLDEAKRKSAAEFGTRVSRTEEEAIIDSLKNKLLN